jgi:hypothetical protein
VKGARPVLATAAVAAATAGLFIVSRGKWSDAIIDSGREWIVPDALARGELLYRDVVYWFGPFTPYAHAAVFRILGSGFGTLVVAGALGALSVLAALWFSLRGVAGRSEASLGVALAIPLLVFMPNAGGALLGMGYRIWHAAAFGLAALPAAASARSRRLAPAVSGALAALAGLCRTEWGAMVFFGAALVVLRATRSHRAKRLAWLSAGFLLTTCAGWAVFVVRAGAGALLRESPVFLLNLPEATRSHVVPGAALSSEGAWNLVYACAVWAGVFLLLDVLSSPRGSGAAGRRLPAIAAVLALALVAALRGALSGPAAFSAAPAVCAAAVIVGWRRGRHPRSALLLGAGAVGLLALHRRFIFIGDGPYVAPPLLFTLVCLSGLAWELVVARRGRASRIRLRAAFQAASAVLIVLAFLDRAAGYALDDRVPIGGTAGMLSARPELARGVEDMAARIRGLSSAEGGLVVMPEGEVLNHLSGWRNPIRHKLYLPGYLSSENESAVQGELEAAMPGAIVLLARSTGEYGGGEFGQGYGGRIRDWIDRRYEPLARTPLGTLYVPRTARPGETAP